MRPIYNHYTYEGPVLEGLSKQCLKNKFISGTFAPSEKKARSNMAFQFKHQYKLARTKNIVLPGEIICI